MCELLKDRKGYREGDEREREDEGRFFIYRERGEKRFEGERGERLGWRKGEIERERERGREVEREKERRGSEGRESEREKERKREKSYKDTTV